jgi:hypothetical protein
LKGKSRHFGLFLVLAAIFCAGCEQQLNYPKPKITGLNPTSISAGTPGFNLTVTGGNFTPASTVLWNGSPRVTIFDNTTTLTAEVLSTDIANAGVANIEVETPQPGGGTTTFIVFTINPTSSPVPQISSLTPSGSFVSGAGFAVTITGTNFASLATVTVNGNPRPSAFVNSSTLSFNLSASDVAQAGTLEIQVINPAPNGGSSNSIAFLVKNETPGLSSLSPAGVVAGGANTTLTVTGTSFVPTSTVTVNGAPRATTYVSATSLTATLTAGDLAAAGVDSIAVVNPAPGGGPSNAVILAVNGTPIFGLPVILDLAPDGTQANDGVCGLACNGIPTLTTAGPSTSDDGSFVVFASDSTNLILNQTNAVSNIFLRRTCLVTSETGTTTSSTSCTPSTALVNLSTNGGEANGPSSQPTINGAGDHVAYTSTASNLVNYVAVSGSGRQVYWQATCASTESSGSCTGSTGQAVLVSASADGQSAGNGESYDPVISPDGQYVAFVSTATNLVSSVFVDGITPQVYVRNTCNLIPPAAPSTCVPTSYLVSTPDGTTPANASSSDLAISNTGLFVAFTSTATNLGSTASNPNGVSEVFVRSTCVTTINEIDNSCVTDTTLASTPDGTTPANAASTEPSISSDGRFVAFASTATNLIVGDGPTQEVYVRDTCQGAEVIETSCTPSTQLISTPDGTTPANGLSENPSINGTCSTSTITPCVTGQYVAFSSLASNLGGNVENGIENVYTRNTCNAITTSITTTEELCAPYTFLSSQPPGTSPPPADGSSVAPSISGDGHTVSFISSAENLVAHDTNAMADVFLAPANINYTLTLSLAGTGTGTVTDTTAQINCKQVAATNTTPLTESGTCTARYVSGTLVTLTATASPGFSFTAWGGSATNVTNASCTVTTDSTTTGTCEFSIIANQTATATFK